MVARVQRLCFDTERSACPQVAAFLSRRTRITPSTYVYTSFVSDLVLAKSVAVGKRERIYSPKPEYAHVMCDISRGYPTNEDKISTTFCKEKKKETRVMHPLAPALTHTLTQTFSLNHLANKQLRSSHPPYSLTNSSATDLRTAPC